MPKYKYVDGEKYRVVPQSVLGYALVKEGSDNSLPSGGTEGQVLTKASGTDFDVDWESIPEGAVFIDATPVPRLPEDFPIPDADLVFTVEETLADIIEMAASKPVYLRVTADEGGFTQYLHIPLYLFVSASGMYTVAGGAFTTANGAVSVMSAQGIVYDGVTYFATSTTLAGGSGSDSALIITGTADLDHNTFTLSTPLQDIVDFEGGYLAVNLNGYIIPLVSISSSLFFELLTIERVTSTYIDIARYNVYGYLDNTPWECYYATYRINITS